MAHLDAVTGLRIVRNEMRLRGWDVVEVPGWEDRGHGSVIRPNGEVCHWTAGSPSGATPSLRTVTYGRPDLRNALCHTYSSAHSKPKLYIIAARVAWHAGAGSYGTLRGNADCLGHEPECPGPGRWRPGQLELQADLSRVQMDIFGYPVTAVIEHYEWTPRKPDRSDVGGDPWRQRITASTPPEPEEDIVASIDDLRRVMREESHVDPLVRERINETVRLSMAACAGAVAALRADVGLPADPESDLVHVQRIREGKPKGYDLTDVRLRLEEAARK